MSASVLRVDAAEQLLYLDEIAAPCVIGKGGFRSAADKREGDGATPLGRWPLRGVLLRPDRPAATVVTSLPWRWLREADGWSDEAADAAYNRPVRHPYARSYERLWRRDAAYDAIVVLGHNDAPPVPGAGSAIFFHQWVPDADGDPKATEGCVAVAPETMRALLPRLRPGMAMEITAHLPFSAQNS